MKSLVRTSAVLLPLVAALVVGGAAHARLPSPTPTSTPTATITPSPTWTPWPTATPTLPPEQVARFSGKVWEAAFGGYWHAGFVTAKIGEVICGDETPSCEAGPMPCFHFPVDPPPMMLAYRLDVVSGEVNPGCGYEGALVTFFVGNERAKQTAIWHAGTSQDVNLSTDPPVAYFYGDMTFAAGLDPSVGANYPIGVNVYDGDELCGEETGFAWREFSYDAAVRSNQEKPRCGVEGAEVTFKLRDRQGNIIGVAREKGIWHAWGDGNVGQELNLTMDPVGIALANVGDGRSQHNEAAFWAETSLGLFALGLLGIATGAVLRKRAATR